MIYRETGQFKATYAEDQAIFPILQDRWAIAAMLAVVYGVVPFIANEYWLQAVIIPFLIFALAAIGLNLLTGYAGQVSLGTGGFMAVGGYATYKFTTGFPDLNILIVFLLSGGVAAAVGVLFGLPSLRIKGFYLAVATLAAQFFILWLFNKVGWFFNNNPSGTIIAPPRTMLGVMVTGPEATALVRYFLSVTILIVFALAAKNMVRGRLGRSWMAIRDMDVAAEIIGIRPLPTKLLAFAISSFYCGVAGAMMVFLWLGSAETEAFDIFVSFQVLFMIITGSSQPQQLRGVMLFSLAYFAAALSIIGRTTSFMGEIQSLTMFHFLPSHCWKITGPLVSWSRQLTFNGRAMPTIPSFFSRCLVRFKFSRPQRTCSPVMGLLPYFPMAVRTASVLYIAFTIVRL